MVLIGIGQYDANALVMSVGTVASSWLVLRRLVVRVHTQLYCSNMLVVATIIGSRVSRKTVNSIGRGPAYQDSGKSHR